MAVPQGPGEFQRFDFQMMAFGASGIKAAEAKMAQDVQGYENGETLAIGRDFINISPSKIRMDGFHPG